METTPLRPVPTNTPDGKPTRVGRRVMRIARPQKPIPTDRLKWDAQVRILQAFGRLSSTAQRTVDSRHLSAALNNEVSHHTVGLNHNFWTACGWIKRSAPGEYSAADPLVQYTKHLSVGNEAAARDALRPSILQSWFWAAIEPQVRAGAPISEVLVTLMTAAGVGQEHRTQLNHLLAWLRYAGVVTVDQDDRVVLAVDLSADEEEEAPPPPGEDREQSPPPAAREGATARQPGNLPAPRPLLTFDVSLSVTADDLARLEPEQIKALFEGAAAVASIRNALTS